MKNLERLTVLMYSKQCAAYSVNIARKLMFTHGLKSLDAIPPTQHALYQHAKRAVLIVAFIWRQAFCKLPAEPEPDQWGWEWNERMKMWVPLWTTLPDPNQGCAMLLHCGCTVACRRNCKCSSAGIRCTLYCKCEGGCTNNELDS